MYAQCTTINIMVVHLHLDLRSHVRNYPGISQQPQGHFSLHCSDHCLPKKLQVLSYKLQNDIIEAVLHCPNQVVSCIWDLSLKLSLSVSFDVCLFRIRQKTLFILKILLTFDEIFTFLSGIYTCFTYYSFIIEI